MEIEAMRERFAAARVASLATVSGSGQPHLVPVCFSLYGDALFFAVDEKPKRSRDLRRLQNLHGNPRVSLLVHHYEEDWRRLWWVRLDGMARELGARAEEEALASLAAKYRQYRRERPGGPVVQVDRLRWQGWAANEVASA